MKEEKRLILVTRAMAIQSIRMNSKGLSGVVAILIITLITISAAAIIWGVLNKTVDEGLGEAKSCYDLIGKVSINSKYTCYDVANEEMRVSVSVGDIEIEELIIVISGEDSGKTFKLTTELTDVPDVYNYTRGNEVKLPGKNSGATYIISGITEEPVNIELAPTLNNQLCQGEHFSAIGFCSEALP